MSLHTKFSASEINRLRRQAARAAEPPEDGPEGWSISQINPQEILAVFKSLHLKEGYALRGYQFVQGGNGNGFVWAIPADTVFPPPRDCPRLSDVFLEPPKPPLALSYFMEAIEGDGTPWSYMCASLLARELWEFGAMWHGCYWSTHLILGSNPWKGARGKNIDRWISSAAEWEWKGPQPTTWKPQVVHDQDRTIVTFFSYSQLGQETIFQHNDVYLAGSYKFDSNTQEIALGNKGFIF